MVLFAKSVKAVPVVPVFVPPDGVPTTVRPRAAVYSVQPEGQFAKLKNITAPLGTPPNEEVGLPAGG